MKFVMPCRLTGCVPTALMPDGSGNMAKNKRLKGYMESILKENGPMTSTQNIEALHERRERMNAPKSVPGVNQIAQVLRRHKEFTSTGEMRLESAQGGTYTVQVWYVQEKLA